MLQQQLRSRKYDQSDEVEIIILARNSSKIASDSYPLKGTVISDEEPFEPATSPDDWEVLMQKVPDFSWHKKKLKSSLTLAKKSKRAKVQRAM